jgi:hypothetical protein
MEPQPVRSTLPLPTLKPVRQSTLPVQFLRDFFNGN